MRCALAVLAAWCVVLGLAPGPLLARCAAILPGADAPLRRPAAAPARHRCAADGRHRGGARRARRRSAAGARASARRRPRRPGHRGSGSSRRCSGPSAGFTKPVRLVLESLLRPEREISVQIEGGIVQSVAYTRPRAPADRGADLPAGGRRGAALRAAWARRLQSGRLGVYVAVSRGPARHAARPRARRAAGMSQRDAIAGVVQVCGIVLAGPAAPGPHAVDQGASAGPPRRIAAPALPRARAALGQVGRRSGGHGPRLPAGARDRRRRRSRSPGCSSRSRGTRPAGPSGTTPSRSSVCSRSRASRSPRPPGTPANGFGLQGASRDLAISVAVEAALVRRARVRARWPPRRPTCARWRPRAPGSTSGATPLRRWRCSRSCSSSSPRRAGSRSTTPTRTSS